VACTGFVAPGKQAHTLFAASLVYTDFCPLESSEPLKTKQPLFQVRFHSRKPFYTCSCFVRYRPGPCPADLGSLDQGQ
jgi:hypothetical protein